MKTASGRFRGIPVAPHVAAQSPADFHPAVQRSVERDPVKSRITQQLPVRATFEGVESEPFRFEFPADIIRKSKCSTDFKRNDFLKKNEAYPLGALRSLKFAYRKLRISLFVELAV